MLKFHIKALNRLLLLVDFGQERARTIEFRVLCRRIYNSILVSVCRAFFSLGKYVTGSPFTFDGRKGRYEIAFALREGRDWRQRRGRRIWENRQFRSSVLDQAKAF